MASSLLALIDDIATLLDDVSVMTKVAAKKTAGVLGDDLALNAQQVSGINANRELPVVFAVFKGSLINKIILVPLALLISKFFPWAITPLLMLGGVFLCFEGFEKIAHKFLHNNDEDKIHHEQLVKAISDEKVDILSFEKEKVKGAIRTDFILSAEIIAISLGVVKEQLFINQVVVLSLVALMMTFFVYGLVAAIVKIDDIGFWLNKKSSLALKNIGMGMIKVTPYLMKLLSVLGTAAMFLVGGGIISHGIHFIHHFVNSINQQFPTFSWLISSLVDGTIGLLTGLVTLLGVISYQKLVKK